MVTSFLGDRAEGAKGPSRSGVTVMVGVKRNVAVVEGVLVSVCVAVKVGVGVSVAVAVGVSVGVPVKTGDGLGVNIEMGVEETVGSIVTVNVSVGCDATGAEGHIAGESFQTNIPAAATSVSPRRPVTNLRTSDPLDAGTGLVGEVGGL
jgi:hypothetical protein